ncbi:MAG: hypothetical protein K0T99_02560 [Alphaproteobacteria bacterium]|nr:hypothetical protein [Alphaproteobacteria bacterium]
MIKNLFKIILLSFVLVASSCSHRKVTVNRVSDMHMSCDEIMIESRQLEDMLQEIDGKTGMSGRNVGMALLFWPGIFVNEMSGNEAAKLANDRLAVLTRLYGKNSCGQKNSNNEKQNKVEEDKS